MSNGLPNYGRYISRPSLAELNTETSGQRFPFPFALVTFADNTPPVVVFDQKVYQFLAPGDARRLVDSNGVSVVEAAPFPVPSATNYLTVQNASGTDPVAVQATNLANTDVSLLIGSGNSGLAALGTGDDKAYFVAGESSGTRALRRAVTPGTTESVLSLDRVAESGGKSVNDGCQLQFRMLDASVPGNPFGSSPVTAASISARIHATDGSMSSLTFDLNNGALQVLVLNSAGATVAGKVALDGIVYRAGVSPSFVGSDLAASGSTFKSISNSNVQDSSIISITPRNELVGASNWWVDIPPGGLSFQVSFDAALGSDWRFDYEIKRVS